MNSFGYSMDLPFVSKRYEGKENFGAASDEQ
jgi:hypothetical protein